MATRRERVVLDLEDKFSGPMAGAAAKAALLNRELQSLDKSSTDVGTSLDKTSKSTESLGGETQKTSRKTREYTLEMALADEKATRLRKSLRDQAKATLDAGTELERAGFKAQSTGNQIDRMSGRLRLFGEAALVLGPALVPIGAAVVPALSAMAMGMTVAAAAAGTAVLAFKGVGDGLKALDKAQLEPTVENLQALRDEMDKLGPAGAHFVRFLDSLEPALASLQMAARDGLLPGVEDGIRELLTSLPQVREFVHGLATEMGNLAEATGKGLTGDGFEAFFNYMRTDAASTLSDFAHTLGNVTEGVANLMVAFAPLTRDFTGGMESMTASFADWSAGLGETDGFRGFVDYIQSTGPMVLDLLGSLGTAFVGIITAAAPLGQALIPALTALADVISLIAGSSIGPALFTAAAGLVAWNRACLLAGPAAASLQVGMTGIASAAGPLAAVLGAGMFVGFIDGLDDASASLRQMDADLAGLAAGDVSARLNDLSTSAGSLGEALQEAAFNDLHILDAADEIKELDTALAGLASTDPKGAARAFAEISRRGKDAGLSTKDLAKIFPQYADAAYLAAKAAERSAAATNSAGDAARKSRAEIRGMVTAMQEQRKAALAAFDAQTAYRQALKDAQAQAAKNNAGIRGNSKAVLENREKLSALIGAWNANSAAVKNNISKFGAARDAFIETARAMGVPRRAAEQLADRLMEIPRSVVSNVTVNTGAALSALAEARRQLENMPDAHANIFITKVPISGPGGQRGGYEAADGGTVPSSGLPYADRWHYLLADKEEVISNRRKQADRYRPVLKAINADMPREVIRGMLADGGTVARYAAAARSNAGHSSSTSLSVSPQVSLAGAQITAVFPGVGEVIGEVVDTRIGEHRNHDSARSRAQSYRGTDAY